MIPLYQIYCEVLKNSWTIPLSNCILFKVQIETEEGAETADVTELEDYITEDPEVSEDVTEASDNQTYFHKLMQYKADKIRQFYTKVKQLVTI